MPVVSGSSTAAVPSGAASGDLTGTYPGPTIATTKVVKSIAKAGSTALKDAVTLTGGTNVTLTQAGQDISIAAAGGSQPLVSCLLARDAALDIKTVDRAIAWDALYDNAVDFNALLAIPAGLGLSFAFDGSSAAITVTEDGTWAFACQLNREADATWAGSYISGTSLARPTVWPGLGTASSASCVFTDVLTLPSGTVFSPTIGVTTGATSGSYDASGYLSIVRLG